MLVPALSNGTNAQSISAGSRHYKQLQVKDRGSEHSRLNEQAVPRSERVNVRTWAFLLSPTLSNVLVTKHMRPFK